MAENNLYCTGAIQPPTIHSLRESATRTGLQISDEQLKEYGDIISSFIPAYTLVASLPEPTLPVKYPRTPGYRPPPSENTYNAWYWKTHIVGAPEGLLAGKKVTIKDIIAVAGVPFMAGSKVMEGYIPEFDATLVTRILDAGGIITGKAACENLCWCASSVSNGFGPVKNPCAPTRATGGSSSGSGALVASGECDISIGTDSGGSVRIPASLCGIVGMKATFGLVPNSGALAMETSLDHMGPMARTVTDVALCLEAIAGVDGFDPQQPTTIEVPKYSEMLSKGVNGMKIGFLQEGFDPCQTDVSDVVKQMMPVFKSLGMTGDWVSIPEHAHGDAICTVLFFMGWWNTVTAGGSGVGYRGFYPTSLCEHFRRGMESAAKDAGQITKLSFLHGDYVKMNYGNQFYNKIQNLCPVYTKYYDDVLEKYDVLFMPTVPSTAPQLPSKDIPLADLAEHSSNMTANTSVFNYTGHPAITLNVGFSQGLPVGGMIVGKKFQDEAVLRVAYALEQALSKKD